MEVQKGGGASHSPQQVGVTIPPCWSEAAEAISRTVSSLLGPVVAICGSKNSGKSTFSRFLLNTLLQRHWRVAYLDTDVGQPEFSPPGCISLHIVDKLSFFFGDISSKRDPEAYLTCVYNLYDYFFTQFQSNKTGDTPDQSVLPLIINTPGWIKGTGYDILVEILNFVSPTVVVQLRISLQRKNLPTGAFWLDGIVRVDVSRGLLYVITPVPIESLQKVDILLQGLIEIPTRLPAFCRYLDVSPYMCTNVVDTISYKNLREI